MQQKGKYDISPHPIVIVHQVTPASVAHNKETGYYADNLAFSCEDEALLATRSANDVYSQLSQPLDQNGITDCNRIDGRQPINKWLFWRAVIAGFLLAASIIILYLWIHVQYINPMIMDIFKISPPSHVIPIPKTSHLKFIDHDFESIKSKWRVDYDLPAGIPVIK